jgi:hypothetical protein
MQALSFDGCAGLGTSALKSPRQSPEPLERPVAQARLLASIRILRARLASVLCEGPVEFGFELKKLKVDPAADPLRRNDSFVHRSFPPFSKASDDSFYRALIRILDPKRRPFKALLRAPCGTAETAKRFRTALASPRCDAEDQAATVLAAPIPRLEEERSDLVRVA